MTTGGALAGRRTLGQQVELVGLAFDPRSRVRRVLAEQTLLAREARQASVDLLHNLFTTAPAFQVFRK